MPQNQPELHITHEKHLDHMVRVVPLIVLGYAVHCYLILQMNVTHITSNALLFLGICLVSMITGFILYDVKHKVEFFEDHLSKKFLGPETKLLYSDIVNVHISEKEQSFCTLVIELKNHSKIRFYFVDDADKIKQWLDQKQLQNQKLAA